MKQNNKKKVVKKFMASNSYLTREHFRRYIRQALMKELIKKEKK